MGGWVGGCPCGGGGRAPPPPPPPGGGARAGWALPGKHVQLTGSTEVSSWPSDQQLAHSAPPTTSSPLSPLPQVALPLAGGLFCPLALLAGAQSDDVVPAALALLTFGAVCLVICWRARKQVPAVVRLLRMAADCMAANPWLTRVAVAVCMAAVATVTPLAWFFGEQWGTAACGRSNWCRWKAAFQHHLVKMEAMYYCSVSTRPTAAASTRCCCLLLQPVRHAHTLLPLPLPSPMLH